MSKHSDQAAVKEVVEATGTYTVSSSIYDTDIEFVPHDSGSPYLSREVPYDPVAKVREQLEQDLPFAIKNRGEAHITTIAPPEFSRSLKRSLRIKTIDDIATSANIQGMAFQVLCVGEGKATIKGKVEHTYFLVVKSDELLGLRRTIRDAYVTAGGAQDDFLADEFQPHITIGFTSRDLFAEDGVIKDEKSCIHPVKLQ